jgi:hypothetical protein
MKNTGLQCSPGEDSGEITRQTAQILLIPLQTALSGLALLTD